MMQVRSTSFVSSYIFCALFFVSTLSAYAATSVGKINLARIKNPEAAIVASALTHYTLGILHDNHGDPEAAIRQYEKALELKKDAIDIYLKLGADLLLLKRLDDAIVALEEANVLDPNNTKAYLLLALVHTARGEVDRSQELYETVLKYEPENLKALAFLSDLYVSQQKLDKAAEVYERILKIRRDDAFIYFNLGVIYGKLNRIEKAAERLEKAVEVDQTYLEAQMVLGMLYEINGQYSKAIAQYENVSSIDSLNTEANIRLSQIYYRLGQPEKAIEHNEVLMQVNSGSLDPYLRNFSIFLSNNEYTKAESILKEALQKGFSDGIIYASLGYLSSLKKKYNNAIEQYSIAIGKSPDNDVYKFYMAVAFDQAGKRKEAEECLVKLVENDSKISEVYNYLGYMYAEDNKKLDMAVDLIEKALGS
jgi:tetratricopeptide (TPR) repeat protein